MPYSPPVILQTEITESLPDNIPFPDYITESIAQQVVEIISEVIPSPGEEGGQDIIITDKATGKRAATIHINHAKKVLDISINLFGKEGPVSKETPIVIPKKQSLLRAILDKIASSPAIKIIVPVSALVLLFSILKIIQAFSFFPKVFK
jgi:hypothetical protein